MKTLFKLLALMLVLTTTSCNYAIVNMDGMSEEITKMAEIAYFEGQKDAINNDIRIRLNSDSIYIWTKSCWDSGRDPIFNPTYLHTKYTVNPNN